MKVSGTRTVSPASTKKVGKTKASGGPAFASHLQDVKDEPEGPTQVSEVSGVTAVGSILAAQEAINSPLLQDANIKGAKGLLVNISGPEDMTIHELNDASSIIY